MSGMLAPPTLETCEVVWWRGYTKGRFQAYTSPSSQLIAESPEIRWRSSARPGPSEAVVKALDALTQQLIDAGWEVTSQREEAWFGLVLSRPVVAEHDGTLPERGRTLPPLVASEPRRKSQGESHLDAALLAQLQAQLADACLEVEHERKRRSEAESRALRLVEPQRAVRPNPPRKPLLFGVYALAVITVAAISLIVYDSIYATVVAALTATAVTVAVDSWFLTRRRIAAPRQL
jgi:hypothetical protein